MYWLVGVLIMLAMTGALAVADKVPLPISPILLEMTDVFILPLWLMVLALISISLSYACGNTAKSSFSLPYHTSHFIYHAKRLSYRLAMAILAMSLVFGSALHALLSDQRADRAEVTDTVRVQALVTIEGISDSVYDAATDSGYRQVAVISEISPLISALTSQDLDQMTAQLPTVKKNSLSKDMSTDAQVAGKSYRVLLSAYPRAQSADKDAFAALNHLKSGDQLFMSLALTPLASPAQALNNPTGFDSYRWLRGRHMDGNANILAIGTTTVSGAWSGNQAVTQTYLQRFRAHIDQSRWQLRQHFYTGWHDQTAVAQQAKAVTLSLLTGDRSLIDRDTKDLYQLAGISHLLAISGTHVLFLAVVLAGSVVLLIDQCGPVFYRHIPRWQVRWWVMIGAAFVYALFTGFDVPAARTAWMLLAVGAVRLTLLPISTLRVLFALAILMAWQDPYVLWQAGYWLSFMAVVLLLQYGDKSSEHPRAPIMAPQTNADGDKTGAMRVWLERIWGIGTRIFVLQFWLFISLLPITLLLFGKASLWGLVINVFAIGLFGWVIVPLNLLAGLFYLLSPAIADHIWALVAGMLARLHEGMTWLTSLSSLSDAWLYTPVNMAILLMVLLGLLPWLLPRGFLSRRLALAPLTLLLLTVYANQQSVTLTPTLYVLPTGDHYISATLLQYPISRHERIGQQSVGWLFLADHRPKSARTLPSRLTAKRLFETLEQQLGRLSIDKLEGIVVQSGSVGLTDKITHNKRTAMNTSRSMLLARTAAQLHQHIPIRQYWQAGRFERWSTRQRPDESTAQSQWQAGIRPQGCESGEVWQLPGGGLSIQALTGWRSIEDDSVWDCSVAIDTHLPIQVRIYHAADPLSSALMAVQPLAQSPSFLGSDAANEGSRLILNADTHPRVWQIQMLLCPSEPLFTARWLGHSTSSVTADAMSHQRVSGIMTYDDQSRQMALTIDTAAPVEDK